MLSFERSAYLAIALLSVAVAVVAPRLRRDAVSVALPFMPPGGEGFIPPIRSDFLILACRWADIIGAVLLAVAAAGPIAVNFEPVFLKRGADILFVLDSSPSMAARDMGESDRFSAAKNLVLRFAESRPADAIGLISVGQDAALLIPPTVDRRALIERLGSAAIAELGDGTALGLGLSIAAFHLRTSPADRKAVILLTDGENNAGDIHPFTAAAAVRLVGASLWVVGIGSSGEVPVDYVDPETGRRRRGIIESRFDPNALRAIARAGSGVYVPAPDVAAFAAAFSRVSEAEALPVPARARHVVKPLHAPLILAGLLFFIVARFVRRVVLGAFF